LIAFPARIGVVRALNRHVERVFDTSRKPHHWGKRRRWQGTDDRFHLCVSKSSVAG
jgi:hypothetical protein